jgi:carbamoyl-phosphate synthase large subunit
MADMDPCAAGLYLVAEDRRLLVPRGDAELVPFLLPGLQGRPRSISSDGCYADVPGSGDRSPIRSRGSNPCLRACRDKHVLLDQVRGIAPVPDYEPLTQDVADRVTSFPRFVKPRLGAGSRGAAKITRREDLEALPKDGSYLVQEYLPGEEYSVDVYVRGDGEVVAAVPRERMKTDSGVAVTARTVHSPEVIEAAVRVGQAIGVRYVANVQVKRAADGVFKLLEVNPRFPGTLPLTIAAGVDMPKFMVDEVAGKKLPDGLVPFKEIMVVRYWTEHYCDPQEWRNLCRPQ